MRCLTFCHAVLFSLVLIACGPSNAPWLAPTPGPSVIYGTCLQLHGTDTLYGNATATTCGAELTATDPMEVAAASFFIPRPEAIPEPYCFAQAFGVLSGGYSRASLAMFLGDTERPFERQFVDNTRGATIRLTTNGVGFSPSTADRSGTLLHVLARLDNVGPAIAGPTELTISSLRYFCMPKADAASYATRNNLHLTPQ